MDNTTPPVLEEKSPAEERGLFGSLLRGDKVIWAIFFILCFISIIELFSASSMIAHKSASYFSPMTSHITHLLLGFGVLLVVSNIPYRFFKVIPFIVGPLTVIALIYLLAFGEKTNDAARSFNIGGFPLQPSEFAKLVLIIYVSFILSMYQEEEGSSRMPFQLIMFAVLLICLAIFPENVSTSIMIGFVCFLLMIIGRIEWKYLLGLISIILIFAATIYITVPLMPKNWTDTGLLHRIDMAINRIKIHQGETTFPKTAFEISDEDHQVYHAKMAIANGGIKPFGTFPGNSVERDFLPLAFSDFIFAIIIEEMGIPGAVFVMLLYLFLVMRAGVIARKCKRSFPALLILGCALMITVQALVNMAVAVNLIPVTGQPLPLISKGGSSILITCIFIGMMLSISRFAVDEEELNSELDNEKK